MNTPSVDPSAFAAIGIGYGVATIAVYVWIGLALSRVFRKSGVEGWKAWVPVLNVFVLLQLGGFSGWFVLLGFVPVANLVFVVVLIMAYHRINVSFGHGAGMTVLAALLMPVWASILGFGSSRWVGRESTAPAGPLRAAPPLPPAPASSSAAPGAPPAFPGAPGAGYGAVSVPPAYGTPRPAPSYGAPSAPGAFAPQPGPSAPGQPPTVPASPVSGAPAFPTAPGGAAPAWMPRPPQTPANAVPPAAPDAGPLRSRPVAEIPPHGAFAPSAAAAGVPATPAMPGEAPAAPPAVPPAPAASAPAPAAPASAPVVPPPVSTAPLAASRPADGTPGPSRTRGPVVPDVEDSPWSESGSDGWGAPESSEVTDAVTAAVPGAPAPVAAVPSRVEPVEPISPPVTRVPSRTESPEREPWAPALSPTPDADAFPEASGPVSAIAGAPDAGAPRSARASVSALHTRPHVPDEDELFDETVVTRRRRTPWSLVPASGRSVAITAEVVILGRRPVADPGFPGAQLVSIDDDTRTVSKTHARLELQGEGWVVIDLDSTNGVLLADASGAEIEVPAGVATPIAERFLLGDAEIRLERSEA